MFGEFKVWRGVLSKMLGGRQLRSHFVICRIQLFIIDDYVFELRTCFFCFLVIDVQLTAEYAKSQFRYLTVLQQSLAKDKFDKAEFAKAKSASLLIRILLISVSVSLKINYHT